MSEHITVGELCARHIGRQVILSQDGKVHQIAGRQVLLIGITQMLTCTCIDWLCDKHRPPSRIPRDRRSARAWGLVPAGHAGGGARCLRP